MHVTTGKVYAAHEIPYLSSEITDQLVTITGDLANVERVSSAVKHYSDATSRDRDRRRTARKTAKASRRKNRT